MRSRANPNWKQISDGIPTNAIGSIAVDPNDPTGKTIYVGTGEGNASGDSEAGLGLYKTTDGGSHWSLVPGSFAAANLRSITWVAIQPGNAQHILFSTRSGTRGEASNSTNTATVAAASPPLGVYNSTDGGASFTQTLNGSVNEVKFDPGDANTVYAALAGSATGGLLRSTTGGAGGWTPIFQENRGRFSFAAVSLPNGKTRIYLGDANGGGHGRAGLSHRRREPAGVDADRVEQRRVDAALEPERRHARVPRLQLLRLARSGRSARTTCSSCRRPTARTWWSSAG